ncbi:hypothetical protein [Streptomyces sp. NPDC048639]|uniref:hypothetical protein n=1 Tax=Streptomyces sp. NPDC048639 TaxID=3365581 RepID=UPI0037129C12
MTVIAALAAVAVAVPVTTACSAVEKALDCAQTADAILTSVEDLQQAASSAVDNPAEAERALDRIDKNLDDIGDKTDNADVSKAVDDLNGAVKGVRESVDQGKTPDVTPVTNAANELTKVCSPG